MNSYQIAAIGTITDDGNLECPSCHSIIITPEGWNPYTGKTEKFILDPNGDYQCHCGITFTISQSDAKKHNHHWFPDDPNFL